MSYIYVVTNKVNGKQYVGQHHYDGEGIDCSYKGSGKLIKQAYDKYGTNNFTIDVLEYCSDISLDELEIKWIQTLNTISPNGYNIRSGGYGMSEYDRKMISKRQIDRYKTDEEYHQKIADHLNSIRHLPRKERVFICPLKLAYLNTQNKFLYELEEEFNCDKRIIKKRADKYGIKLNQKPAFDGKKHTEETKKIMKQKAIERWKTKKH